MRRLWRRDRPLLGLVLAIVGLCLAVLVLAVAATTALHAADKADRATACNGLLLESIALRSVPAQAREEGCDVAVAQAVIDRSRVRDLDMQKTRAALVQVAVDRAALERQLVDLGQRPVTRTTAPRPVVTVIPGPTTVPRPSAPVPTVSPRPTRTPAPTRSPSPVPSPVPSPAPPGLLDSLCKTLPGLC